MKKQSLRMLRKELKLTKYQLGNRNEDVKILANQNKELKAKLEGKVDDRMIQQRIELCRNLGQMIEATSKAIMFIVAKEAI